MGIHCYRKQYIYRQLYLSFNVIYCVIFHLPSPYARYSLRHSFLRHRHISTYSVILFPPSQPVFICSSIKFSPASYSWGALIISFSYSHYFFSINICHSNFIILFILHLPHCFYTYLYFYYSLPFVNRYYQIPAKQ